MAMRILAKTRWTRSRNIFNWSMDFISDQLFDGRRFRALTLVDNYSRECLEIEAGQNLKGIDVVAVMERIKT